MVLFGPFIETFIRALRVTSCRRFYCLTLNGTELKILALVRPWLGEWTAQCNNIGCLFNHASPAWALLDIRNNAIMFRDEQNKLSYCHRTGMVEVAKPIIMANAVHQGLQGNYFLIRYLLFQNTEHQKYALSYCVNFI